MKIEIGESLILSWLRHAKHCQMVQLNWKPSINAWSLQNQNTIEKIIIEATDHFNTNYEMNIFKKNSSWSQLLQQGEIDALGIDINSGVVKSLFAVDIAFHESGLNYGSKEETVARIVKKMIRSALLTYGYFNVHQAEFIFATPKVHLSTLKLLTICIADLSRFFEKYNLQYEFTLICNDEFKNQIFNVVTAFAGSISDTSELFMRSIQMYNLFSNEPIKSGVTDLVTSPVNQYQTVLHNVNLNVVEPEVMKIAVLVKSTFKRLIELNLLSHEETIRLTDKDYSKEVFKLHIPALKKHIDGIPIKDQIRINDRPRYYPDTYVIHGDNYYLCNHWVEKQSRKNFKNWINQFSEFKQP